MKTRRVVATMFLAIALSLSILVGTASAQAQTSNTAPQADNNEEINLDTQMFLIVGTNQDVGDSKLPTALDPVIKQLRASLPFKNYRLAATLLNRVKNESRLELSWIGGPIALSGNTLATTPSFSQFKVRSVKLVRNNEGQQMVQMIGFNFGARIPIQTSGPVASNGTAVPVISYENTGLSTDISMREGEPVIIGTLNVGPSGDAIILVVSARKTNR